MATVLLCACERQQSTKECPTRVETAVAIPADQGLTLSFPARIEARQEMQIAFRVSGTIAQVHVKEGQRVRKGQLLVTMDDRDYAEQLRATEAEYARIKAQADRVEMLYGDEATTADNYDAARYGLQQMESKLNHHRNQLADTRLTSPIDGYVQDIIFRENETVGAGMGVLSIVGADGVQAEASIPAKNLSERERFGEAYCVLDASGQIYPVTLSGIKQKATATQVYIATFDLPADAKALIGEGCSIIVTLAGETQQSTAVKIPLGAVIDKNDTLGVYVVTDSMVTFTKIELGPVSRDGGVIVSGLQPGQTVVSSGAHSLNDGQKVVPIIKPNPKTNKGELL